MYSASLLTTIIHNLPPAALAAFMGFPGEPAAPSSGTPAGSVPDEGDMAARLGRALEWPTGEWPLIPVVARARPEEYHKLLGWMPSDTPRDDVARFLWGRIPLDVLLRHYIARGLLTADRELLDLGTPIIAASGAAGGSAAVCSTLLARTPAPGAATVGAAIVDLGDAFPGGLSGTPKNYNNNNKLHHAVVPAMADVSAHAEDVLAILLERLDSKPAPGSTTNAKMLDITTVSMALVSCPTPDEVRRSKGCFDQHCAPEMLTAVQEINNLLNKDQLPAVVNMSLGTHVGPHNGSSPLEAYIAGSVFKPSERFLFAAAGNEGGKGISSRLPLKQDETDYMEIVVDAACTELLVEFWWDDAGPADLEIASMTTGSGLVPAPVNIGPGTKATFTQASARPNTTFFTLLQAPSHGSMSCIAFAITRTPPRRGGSLPELRVSFDLTAKSADTTVQAWVVLSEKAMRTHFTQGGPSGTISAPASDPKTISVTGYDGTRKQMWRQSSRGPASSYVTETQSPAMAHLSDPSPSSGSTEHGTSWASPRAAADATQTLAVVTKLANATTVETLLQQTYGSTGPWNERYGFHQEKS